ncbi:MAG: energy transducer TonB [Acidobacteria bacterium]|nr:energy transducer TonB [Acidobacteriota bacterium]
MPTRILGLRYPRVARAARIEGVVQARCSVRSDGSVADVTIHSGHPLLVPEVKANLRRWRFQSSSRDERPTAEAVVTYDFKLRGRCDEYNRCDEEFWFEGPNRVIVLSEMPRLNPGHQ